MNRLAHSILTALMLTVALTPIVCGDEPKKQPSLECVVTNDKDGVMRIWAFPVNQNLDRQSIGNRHLPCIWIEELNIILHPHRLLSIKKFSLEEISTIDERVSIDLAGTNLKDDDLEQLAKCKRLEHLILDFTDVSDLGIAKLAKCGSLATLNVYRTKVSKEGIRELLSSNKRIKVNVVLEGKMRINATEGEGMFPDGF